MPGWGRGRSGQLDSASVYPSVAERVLQVCALWGTSRWQERAMTAWPALTQVPRHKQCPQARCPPGGSGPGAWLRTVGKGLWPVMSTGRPRAPRFSLLGLRPLTAPEKHPGSARPTLVPRLPAFWPWGLRRQGWPRTRSGGPHQAIGAGPPNISPQPRQDLKGPFNRQSNRTGARPEGFWAGVPQSRGPDCRRLVSAVTGPTPSHPAQA